MRKLKVRRRVKRIELSPQNKLMISMWKSGRVWVVDAYPILKDGTPLDTAALRFYVDPIKRVIWTNHIVMTHPLKKKYVSIPPIERQLFTFLGTRLTKTAIKNAVESLAWEIFSKYFGITPDKP